VTDDDAPFDLVRRLLPHALSFAIGVALALFGLVPVLARAPFRSAGLGLMFVVGGLTIAFLAAFAALSVVLE